MLDVGRDRGICDFENFRNAPVVHLDLKDLRVGVTFRKFEDVLEIGAPPRVNRLRVVAHHHDVAMFARQKIDQVGLDLIRILIFVDQDELKLPAIKRGDVFVLLQHRQRLFEQIVEIDRVRRLFLFLVAHVDVGNFFEQRQKIRKLFGKQFFERRLGVNDKAENLR